MDSETPRWKEPCLTEPITTMHGSRWTWWGTPKAAQKPQAPIIKGNPHRLNPGQRGHEQGRRDVFTLRHPRTSSVWTVWRTRDMSAGTFLSPSVVKQYLLLDVLTDFCPRIDPFQSSQGLSGEICFRDNFSLLTCLEPIWSCLVTLLSALQREQVVLVMRSEFV